MFVYSLVSNTSSNRKKCPFGRFWAEEEVGEKVLKNKFGMQKYFEFFSMKVRISEI
jgi:hypothetical protein